MEIPSQTKRILVVEDEAALSLLLCYNLEAEGFVVERVERGDEAELKLEEAPFDLLILDWMLPGVSGLEICRRLRARDATRTLPVIMLTARGEEAERVRGLAVGADDYVVKPFSVPELMARVKALLRRAKPECIAAQVVELDHETKRLPPAVAMSRPAVRLPGRVASFNDSAACQSNPKSMSPTPARTPLNLTGDRQAGSLNHLRLSAVNAC